MEAPKDLEIVSQALAKTKTPGHNNHHDDSRDRCLDCGRLVIMPDDKPDDIIADEEPYYCVCFSESEDIGSDDGNESSTVTAGVQPQSLLLSGDGTRLQDWDLPAIQAQAMMRARDYHRQIKEAVEQFEGQVTQTLEEKVWGVDRLNRLIELENEREQGQEVVENGDAGDGEVEDGALDRQMAEMGREKRPRSPSPDGSDMDGEPPRGRARLGSRPLSSDAVVD